MPLTAESLAQAMGDTLSGDRYRDLLPAMNDAMIAAQITNPKRAAAWCSQIGHESAGLKYMAEIQTSSPTWNADRTRYRGRGPIQLTWSGNYRKFGQWCAQQGYVTDPELFVNQPELVEQPRWGFLAASWYWLNGGPRPGQINGYADKGDILAVSRCVNGWVEGKQPNGMLDRQARWDTCLRMGDAIVPFNQDQPPVQEDTMGFTGDPVWLEQVLRDALSDRLVVESDWAARGTGGTMGDIWGVLIHHTGNDRESVQGIRDGRPDLSGPLSQCLITPDGKCHLIAVGPCNHAGIGSYPGIGANNGNQRLIGFECAWPTVRADGSYDPGQKWPDAQIITMRDATAAVLKKLGVDQSHAIGHKEWATKPPNVKWDPGNMDMNWFRGEVGKDLAGQFDAAPVTPTPPPSPASPPANYEQLMFDQTSARWEMLGWNTPVEALAQIRDAVCATKDAGKRGMTRGGRPTS